MSDLISSIIRYIDSSFWAQHSAGKLSTRVVYYFIELLVKCWQGDQDRKVETDTKYW